jgi:hypothetical protein|eukprot:COSAG02_NODE_3396_length_6813_cov_7.067024_5_plen_98_part_00
MDKEAMDRMMAEMRGDFSHVKDKRRRRALEKLKKTGMQVSGATDMDIDQLENVSARRRAITVSQVFCWRHHFAFSLVFIYTCSACSARQRNGQYSAR